MINIGNQEKRNHVIVENVKRGGSKVNGERYAIIYSIG